jgi:hypothetical protein
MNNGGTDAMDLFEYIDELFHILLDFFLSVPSFFFTVQEQWLEPFGPD